MILSKKMWVLVRGMDYEGANAEGVFIFTTEIKAKQFIKKHYPDFKWNGDEWRNASEYRIIYEVEVDEQ